MWETKWDFRLDWGKIVTNTQKGNKNFFSLGDLWVSLWCRQGRPIEPHLPAHSHSCFCLLLTASTCQLTNKPRIHLLFLASLHTYIWFVGCGFISFLYAHSPYLWFVCFFTAEVLLAWRDFWHYHSDVPHWLPNDAHPKRGDTSVCVRDKIGDNVNEHKEAVRRSVTIRNSLYWSRIIRDEKPKNRESPSPSLKNSRLVRSSQLLLFFLLSLEFLLLVSEPIVSCLDLLTRTSVSGVTAAVMGEFCLHFFSVPLLFW